KTELAKVAAAMLGTELIRLQCYEGLDDTHALYEWNYQKQLLRIQVDLDKADEEFEAFLLEVLSDFQVSVPELGTIAAVERPIVVLTSNQRRELSEALKRRCLHLFLEFPSVEKEREIIALKVPDLDERLRAKVAEFVAGLRRLGLRKAPSIAETLDWARALVALGIRELDADAVRRTLAVLLKHEEDVRKAEPKIAALRR